LPGDGKSTRGPALRGMVNSLYGIISFTSATTSFHMTHHGYKRERQMPALNEFACGREKGEFPAFWSAISTPTPNPPKFATSKDFSP
jgi:hypothetical protein